MTTARLSNDHLPRTGRLLSREGLIVLFLAAAHAPLVWLHLGELWSRPHYQFFPIVLFGSVWLFWRRWPEGNQVTVRESMLERFMLVSGLAVLIGAILLFSPWLAAVAAILTVGALLLHFAGRDCVASFLGPWLLLWFLVPPPLSLDRRLIEWMQDSTTRAASRVLDLFMVGHLREGNVLLLPGRELFVEEACSGVQSLFALLALVGLICVLAKIPWMRACLLLLSAFVWAWLANVARILTVVVLLYEYGIDVSSGWRHELLGFVTFTIAVLAVVSTNRLLVLISIPCQWAIFSLIDYLPHRIRRRVLQDRRKSDDDQLEIDSARLRDGQVHDDSRRQSAGRAQPTWPRTSMLCGICGCLLFVQAAVLVFPPSSEIQLSEAAVALGRGSLPSQLETWQLVDYTTEERDSHNEFGQFSKTWHYAAQALNPLVSFDFPFDGWHEVTRCYQSQGWHIADRKVVAQQSTAFVEVELAKPTGERGYLLFTGFDEAGRPLRPPVSATSLKSKFYAKLVSGPASRLLRQASLTEPSIDIETYQLQIFVNSPAITAQQRSEIQSQFIRISEGLRREWNSTT